MLGMFMVRILFCVCCYVGGLVLRCKLGVYCCLVCLLWFTGIAWGLGLVLVYCLLGDFVLTYCLFWYCCWLDLNCWLLWIGDCLACFILFVIIVDLFGLEFVSGCFGFVCYFGWLDTLLYVVNSVVVLLRYWY